MTCTWSIRVPVGVRCSMLFHLHPFIIFNIYIYTYKYIYIYIYTCTSCENKTLVHHHMLFNFILMLFGNCISTEISNVYSQISTIYKCIRYLCIYIYVYINEVPFIELHWIMQVKDSNPNVSTKHQKTRQSTAVKFSHTTRPIHPANMYW